MGITIDTGDVIQEHFDVGLTDEHGATGEIEASLQGVAEESQQSRILAVIHLEGWG